MPPPPQQRERGGCTSWCPGSPVSPGQDADESPVTEGRGGRDPPPRTGFQPHCRQLRLPAEEGRAQPCRKPRKHPFPSKEARQYDSKSYFHSGKRKARVKIKSEGPGRRQPGHGARGGVPALPTRSPTAPAPHARRTGCPGKPASPPKPCCISSFHRDPSPPAQEGHPSALHRPSSSRSHRAGASGPVQTRLWDPEPDPPSRAPGASSRAEQEKLLLFILPLTPTRVTPGPLSLVLPPPGSDAPIGPWPWLKSDPAQKYIL